MSNTSCKFVDIEADLSDHEGKLDLSSDEYDDEGEWTKEDYEFIVDEDEDGEEPADQGDESKAEGFEQSAAWYANVDNIRKLQDARLCGICNDTIDDLAVLGDAPECTHKFCFLCICTWSRESEQCPLCEATFTEIHHKACPRCVEVRRVQESASQPVGEWKKKAYTSADWDGQSKYGVHYSLYYAGTSQSEDDSDDDDGMLLEEIILSQPCVVCNSKDHEDLTLVCDNCSEVYHIYCLNPPLAEVPQGDWSCDACRTTEERLRVLLGLVPGGTKSSATVAIKVGEPLTHTASKQSSASLTQTRGRKLLASSQHSVPDRRLPLSNAATPREHVKSRSISKKLQDGSSESDDEVELVLMPDVTNGASKTESLGTAPTHGGDTQQRVPFALSYGSRWLQRLRRYQRQQAERRKQQAQALKERAELLNSIRKIKMQACDKAILEHWKKTPSLSLLQAAQSWKIQQKINRQKRLLQKLQAQRSMIQMRLQGGLSRLTKPSERFTMPGPALIIPKKSSQCSLLVAHSGESDNARIVATAPASAHPPTLPALPPPPPPPAMNCVPSKADVRHLESRPLTAKEAAVKFARVDFRTPFSLDSKKRSTSKGSNSKPKASTNGAKSDSSGSTDPTSVTENSPDSRSLSTQMNEPVFLPPTEVIANFVRRKAEELKLYLREDTLKKAYGPVIQEWQAKDRDSITEDAVTIWVTFPPRLAKIEKYLRQLHEREQHKSKPKK